VLQAQRFLCCDGYFFSAKQLRKTVFGKTSDKKLFKSLCLVIVLQVIYHCRPGLSTFFTSELINKVI